MADKKVEAGYYNQDSHFIMPEKVQDVNGISNAENHYKDAIDTSHGIILNSSSYTITKSTENITNRNISTNDMARPKYIMPDGNGVFDIIDTKKLDYLHEGQRLYLIPTDTSGFLNQARLMHSVTKTVSSTYKHTLSLVNNSNKTLYYVGYFPNSEQIDGLALSVKDSNGNMTATTIDPLEDSSYYYRYLNNGDLYRIYLSNNTNIYKQSVYWSYISPYSPKQSDETDDDYYARLKQRACYNMSMLELCNLVYDTSFKVSSYNDTNIGATYVKNWRVLDSYSTVELCTKVSADSSNMKLPYFFICATYNEEQLRKANLDTCSYLTLDAYDSYKTLRQYAHAVTVNTVTNTIQHTNHRVWDTYTYSYNETLYDYMVNAGTSKYSDMMIVYGRNVIFKEE